MNDASFEENDEEENEKAAIKNFIEVKTILFRFLLSRLFKNKNVIFFI